MYFNRTLNHVLVDIVPDTIKPDPSSHGLNGPEKTRTGRIVLLRFRERI